jgi:inhibitor of KinA sporulation pathway (predicted exonuclease)
LIDPEYMTTGTSVDFLSRNLMQFGEEQHTALDDAQRQVKIFDRLNDLRYKMKTGTMGMDDY